MQAAQVGKVFFRQKAELLIDQPIQLLLKRHHPREQLAFVNTVVLQTASQRKIGLVGVKNEGRGDSGSTLGEFVDCSGEGEQWPQVGKRRAVKFATVVFVARFPCLVLHPPADATASFVHEYLLHPEASCRAIQMPEECKVVVFRSFC